MSANSKPDLNAIYRLEFYKNKKYWKFAPEKERETKKKHPDSARNDPSTSQAILNLTYDVEPEADREPEEMETESSPLNEAFLEPEDSLAMEPDKDQISPDSNERQECDELDGWPRQSAVWCHSKPSTETVDAATAVADSVCDGVQSRLSHLLACAPHYQTPHPDAHELPEPDCLQPEDIEECSLVGEDGESGGGGDAGDTDSYSEFERGANLAPHSSQLDLRGFGSDAPLTLPSPFHNEKCWLPSGALQPHTAVLSVLLQEARAPPHCSSPLHTGDSAPPSLYYNYHLIREGPFTLDDIGCLGRGRGRVQTPCIRIEMGRPYRLTH